MAETVEYVDNSLIELKTTNKKFKEYNKYNFNNESKFVVEILNDKFSNISHTDKLDYLESKSERLDLNKTLNEYLFSGNYQYETIYSEIVKHILLVVNNVENKNYDIERLNKRLTVIANLNNRLDIYEKGNTEVDIQDKLVLDNIGDVKLGDVINLIHTNLNFNIALLFVLIY